MDEPYTDQALARSQTEMVKILSTCTTAIEIRSRINASELQDDLKKWLLSCDPEMLETAASLVTKWGSADPHDGVGN
jgi:hypothetical protein